MVADTIDPNDDGSQYAWAENAGWLNLEPVVGEGTVGATVLTDQVLGWAWSENVGWLNLSCENLGGCQSVDFRVTNDGVGNLGGWAWSENAGWVSFSCANTGSCATVDYGVTIDPGSGDFSGFAWAENLGWVSMSCVNTATCGTVEYRVTTLVPFPEAIFFDGFESGDTSAWSVTCTEGCS